MSGLARPLSELPADRPPRAIVRLARPPGVGETLLANEAGVNFLAVRGAEWRDRHGGASEEAIARVFAKARRAAPAILIFDEIDALAPPRGAVASLRNQIDEAVAALAARPEGI